MSNVVQLNAPSPQTRRAAAQAALLENFARHRRTGDDVFWLKENAELLNILECTGAEPEPAALTAHEGFYERIETRLSFFPQYYRFLLSICLDLEDLGLPGEKGAMLADWAARQGLAEAELSDLQRGEARRLMLRRGVDPIADPGLDDRLRRFIARPATFALPNKKAAYELTHTIFYLSEYGRRDPRLPEVAAQSLDFAGSLAFLDQNADLLAEICIAMRFAGLAPPDIWEGWLVRHTRGFTIESGAAGQDDYHEYLVCNWALAARGNPAFGDRYEAGPVAFLRPPAAPGPLRDISQALFHGEDRSAPWARQRSALAGALSEEGQHILAQAEAASADFEAFFAGFARVAIPGAAMPVPRREAGA